MVQFTKKMAILPMASVLIGTGLHAKAATVSENSTAWYGLDGNFDFIADQQTGQPQGDALGSSATGDYGLLVTYNAGGVSTTDGTFGFRIRLDGPGGNNNNVKYSSAAFLGIDADGNNSIDLFVGVNFSGNKTDLGIFDPGTGLNTGPSNTSINSTPVLSYAVSSTNYNYRPVNFPDDGGTTNDLNPNVNRPEVDYYLSVMVDFADIVAFLGAKSIAITDATSLRFIAATSNNGNTLNQDILGIDDKNFNDTGQVWSETGGMTSFVSPNDITLIPEVGSVTLLAAGTGFFLLRRRRI